MKTAVVYDKWLSSLGGGEVVACNIAKILKEQGYDVTFVSGKFVPLQKIKKILKINLSGIKFVQIWNDEIGLKKITKDKDLFINVSFMDYSYGYAKKNIYYTHFPTEAYLNIKGKIFNELILPLSSKIIKPIEFIEPPAGTEIKNNHFAYLMENRVKIAFSYLEKEKTYLLKFSIFFENFYSTLIKNLYIKIDGAKILEAQTKTNTEHNIIHFFYKIKPTSSTIYLILDPKIPKKTYHNFSSDKVYLLYPKIITWHIPRLIYDVFYQQVEYRLRAGIFINILERLKSYDIILCNSEFTKKWIKNYWNIDAKVLYPPVDLLFEKYDLSKIKKENWICSVGRFFTLGHGKKQEVLVEAFKKLYNKGYKDWQLHLVGGVGNEPSSIEFVKYLKKQTAGYPIYFHFNVPRERVEEILLKSKIYWHATGYGENENKHPIKFEHFGIAPIEAISAGCIPILYKGGGLTEIIKNLGLRLKEYVFLNESNLIANSTKFMSKEAKISDFINLHVIKKTKIFSLFSFKKNFLNIIE